MNLGQEMAGLLQIIIAALFLYAYYQFDAKHPEKNQNDVLNDLADQVGSANTGLVKTLKSFTYVRAWLKPSRRTVAYSFSAGIAASGAATIVGFNWAQEIWEAFREYVNKPNS
ncbi:MAG: hypothetical protein COA86_17870 [Kangiella sp.]|nr:MAG: hypothetical protein COA86_17870 [Kangiella sp.]